MSPAATSTPEQVIGLCKRFRCLLDQLRGSEGPGRFQLRSAPNPGAGSLTLWHLMNAASRLVITAKQYVESNLENDTYALDFKEGEDNEEEDDESPLMRTWLEEEDSKVVDEYRTILDQVAGQLSDMLTHEECGELEACARFLLAHWDRWRCVSSAAAEIKSKISDGRAELRSLTTETKESLSGCNQPSIASAGTEEAGSSTREERIEQLQRELHQWEAEHTKATWSATLKTQSANEGVAASATDPRMGIWERVALARSKMGLSGRGDSKDGTAPESQLYPASSYAGSASQDGGK